MEDAYTAVPFLLEVPVHKDRPASADLLPPRIAKEVQSAPSSEPSEDSEAAAETNSTAGQEQVMETLHFFGVFDGHGGAEAALHCAQTLHQRIAEALSASSSPTARSELGSSSNTAFSSDKASVSRESSGAPADASEPAPLQTHMSSQELKALPAEVVPRTSSDLDRKSDELVDTAVMEEQQDPGNDKSDQACSSAKFESAFADAFSRTDAEFAKADNAALIGTTAVAALVGSRHLYVANCGMSFASTFTCCSSLDPSQLSQ